MMRILYRDEQGAVTTALPVDQLRDALKNPASLIWVDLDENTTDKVERTLDELFDFHPLAVDDALHETHVPKVDDWHDYLYVVLRAVAVASYSGEQLEIPELDVFLGSNFIITYASEPIPAIDRVWHACQRDERRLKRGPDYLLYQLTDELATDAVEVVEQMHSDLDAIEDLIFGAGTADVLEDIFQLKRHILKLRRITVPQREVLNKLSRNEYKVIDAADRVFFRDVYDHLMQLNDLLEEMFILVGSALETYLSVLNNRMNSVMKLLTIITAFFMPLTFITGFFGMNFFQAVTPFDHWTGRAAFMIVFALMVVIPLMMFLWMRRRNWI